MNEKSTTEQYAEYLNKNILPFIDYEKLHVSYSTDMVYAKGVLNILHDAMVKVYGDEVFDRSDGEDGFVLVPGVLRGNNGGKMTLALFDLDLSSSGEHLGTIYLSKFGIISQDISQEVEKDKRYVTILNSVYVPYEYGYTAVIPCDHHVDVDELPKELQSILSDFHNHKIDLLNKNEPNKAPSVSGEDKKGKVEKKPSVLDGVLEAEKTLKENKDNEPKNKKSRQEL